MKPLTMIVLAFATLASFAGPLARADAADANMTPDPQGLYAGYRGTTLPMSGHQLAFIKKGARVDVLVTFDALMTDKRKEKVTATILQNIAVVDVIKPAKLDDVGAIQLLLNPNETQYAALSQVQGTIHIVVRAEGDTAMTQMEMATFRKLFK